MIVVEEPEQEASGGEGTSGRPVPTFHDIEEEDEGDISEYG